MVAMMLANAMPASAEGLAKGQNNTNPGYTNDSVGDAANEFCDLVATPSGLNCSNFNLQTGESVGTSNN